MLDDGSTGRLIDINIGGSLAEICAGICRAACKMKDLAGKS